jgi:hypothetical protein
MIWWPATSSLSTATGVVHDWPFDELASRTRASPSSGSVLIIAKPRSAHATYTRPVSSTAIVGYALVRNRSVAVGWSSDVRSVSSEGGLNLRPWTWNSRPSLRPRGKRRARPGGSHLRPWSIERVTRIASSVPSALKRRHATYSPPSRGSIASVAPWLMGSSRELRRRPSLHVWPQSSERDR